MPDASFYFDFDVLRFTQRLRRRWRWRWRLLSSPLPANGNSAGRSDDHFRDTWGQPGVDCLYCADFDRRIHHHGVHGDLYLFGEREVSDWHWQPDCGHRTDKRYSLLLFRYSDQYDRYRSCLVDDSGDAQYACLIAAVSSRSQ